MATIGGASVVPRPEVLSWSTTIDPVSTEESAVPAIATGCSVQFTRSVLVACAQSVAPAASSPDGLCR